ncbi:phage tail protein [Ostreibacterium oceani]|uniref:Oxidoreductase n=1 Tax=Ostreibacterium oceani TaxID=2654998 RepID=A0A6N7EZB6_9GAMM|nr:phage tail protein [Ostreibacterium oceani]MPV86900.1 oxidoreductase [Ostreibacterium oceani]
MMMSWGMFVFGLSTLPYQELSRTSAWRHPTNSRVGMRAGAQYLGQGDETITLPGVLYPEITGGRTAIELARAMADMGQAWPLVERTGKIYGLFVCEGIDDTASEFFDNGQPRKIDFTIKLKRVGDDDLDLLGALTDALGFL